MRWSNLHHQGIHINVLKMEAFMHHTDTVNKMENYKDGVANCFLIGKEVVLRCSLIGKGRQQKAVIICRGPDNSRRYWKKCPHSSTRECPALVTQRGMDKEIQRRIEEGPKISLAGLLHVAEMLKRFKGG